MSKVVLLAVNMKSDLCAVSTTVRPLIADCTGAIYFTSLQIQEGGRLTVCTPHTAAMLRESDDPVRFYNGVARSASLSAISE